MKILQDITKKIKNVPKDDWMVAGVVLLVALLAFGLGRLSVLYSGEGEFKIEYPAATQGAAAASSFQDPASGEGNLGPSTYTLEPAAAEGGGYVASKTGSKYHLPWCAGAQSIKEENKIYFTTKAEAEARGYAPAGNCKGI